jgi:hypothetical protein
MSEHCLRSFQSISSSNTKFVEFTFHGISTTPPH